MVGAGVAPLSVCCRPFRVAVAVAVAGAVACCHPTPAFRGRAMVSHSCLTVKTRKPLMPLDADQRISFAVLLQMVGCYSSLWEVLVCPMDIPGTLRCLRVTSRTTAYWT